MKKKIFPLLLVLLLTAFSCVSAFAATSSVANLNDQAGLLSSDQQKNINDALQDASKKLKMDVMIVTVNEIPEQFPEVDDRVDRFAASLIDGKDAIILLFVNAGGAGNRDLVLATNGEAKKVFDSKISSIDSEVKSYIANGKDDFYGAFQKFADLTSSAKDFRFGLWGAIAAALGAIVGAIRSGSLKSELKSVYSQDEARNYIKKGSFVLNKQYDIPTYRSIERTQIQRSNTNQSNTVVTSSGDEVHVTHSKV